MHHEDHYCMIQNLYVVPPWYVFDKAGDNVVVYQYVTLPRFTCDPPHLIRINCSYLRLLVGARLQCPARPLLLLSVKVRLKKSRRSGQRGPRTRPPIKYATGCHANALISQVVRQWVADRWASNRESQSAMFATGVAEEAGVLDWRIWDAAEQRRRRVVGIGRPSTRGASPCR